MRIHNRIIAIHRAYNGYEVSFFGLKIPATTIKRDTIKKEVIRLVEVEKPKPKAIKSTKKKGAAVKSHVNIQRIEENGSGIQNNAPNYGNQAGRDLYLAERVLTNEELNSVLLAVNNILKERKSECVGFQVDQGSNGGKALAQLKKALTQQGHDLNKGFNGTSVGQQSVKNISWHFDEAFNCLVITIGTFE